MEYGLNQEKKEYIAKQIHAIEKELRKAISNPTYIIEKAEKIVNETRKIRTRLVRDIIRDLEKKYSKGAPLYEVLDIAEKNGMDRCEAKNIIETMKREGFVYSMRPDVLRIRFV